MKGIFFYLVFILVLGNANAQVISGSEYYNKPELKSNLNKHEHFHLGTTFSNGSEDYDYDTIEHNILKKFNSNFRVLDSTDYFTGEKGLWNFESRYRTVRFDHYGNILKGETKFYHSETNSWSPKYLLKYEYRDPRNKVRDFSLRQVWDSVENTWRDDYYVKHTISGGYTELFAKDWDFERNRFTGGFRYLYNLNDQNLASTRIIQKWDTIINNWINESQYSYLYDTNGKTKEVLFESWNKNLNRFVNSRKDEFEYDSYGKLERQTILYWTFAQGWFNGFRFENYYDTDKNLTVVISSKWNSTTKLFEPIQRNENSYNNDNLLVRALVLRKEGAFADYVNFQLMSYDFDSKGNQLSYLNQFWDKASNRWINSSLNSRKYEPKGNLTEILQQKWDINSEYWLNEFQERNQYVRNGFHVQYYKQIWDDQYNQWENQTRRDYYYSGIKENNGHTGNPVISYKDKTEENGIIIYPNPAHDKVTIEFEKKDGLNFTRVELINFYGSLVRTYNVKGKTDLTIQKGGIQNGKYYLRFIGEKVVTSILIFE